MSTRQQHLKDIRRAYGSDPVWVDTMSDEEISVWCENGISRWRSMMPTKQKQKNWVHQYLKKKKMDSESIKHILCNNINKFNMIAPYCKVAIDAPLDKLPEHFNKMLANLTAELIRTGKSKTANQKVADVPRKSVHDYMKEQMHGYLSELEGILDDAMDTLQGKKSIKFSMTKWLVYNEVKAPQAKKIGEWLQPKIEEMNDLIDNKDEQLVEGYTSPGFGHIQHGYWRKFLKNSQNECYDHAERVKPKRKRKKK